MGRALVRSLNVSQASKLLGTAFLPSSSDSVDGNDLHGGLLQRIPATVPRGPDDTVVISMLCVLLCVLATCEHRNLTSAKQRDSYMYNIDGFLKADHLLWRGKGVRVTLIVFSIEMSSMAAVHPPAGPFLQGTVFHELVVVFVRCTELHAIVRCVEFVTGIVAKVITIKGITSISTKEISVRQAVGINFWSKFESGVVGIPEKFYKTNLWQTLNLLIAMHPNVQQHVWSNWRGHEILLCKNQFW